MDANAPSFAAGFALLLGLGLVFLRIRREFRFRPVRPLRLALRMTLLGVLAMGLGLAVAGSALRTGEALAALTIGTALGYWAEAHSRFERIDGELRYRPHPYVGTVLALLVLTRLGVRLAQMPATRLAETPGASGDAWPTFAASPLTLGLLMALIGYQLCYSGRLLWRLRFTKALAVAASTAARP